MSVDAETQLKSLATRLLSSATYGTAGNLMKKLSILY